MNAIASAPSTTALIPRTALKDFLSAANLRNNGHDVIPAQIKISHVDGTDSVQPANWQQVRRLRDSITSMVIPADLDSDVIVEVWK